MKKLITTALVALTALTGFSQNSNQLSYQGKTYFNNQTTSLYLDSGSVLHHNGTVTLNYGVNTLNYAGLRALDTLYVSFPKATPVNNATVVVSAPSDSIQVIIYLANHNDSLINLPKTTLLPGGSFHYLFNGTKNKFYTY